MEGGLWVGLEPLGGGAQAEPAGAPAPPSALPITRVELRPHGMTPFHPFQRDTQGRPVPKGVCAGVGRRGNRHDDLISLLVGWRECFGVK